jgi:hypothetical protein
MSHPAYVDDELVNISSYHAKREVERKILTDKDVLQFIRDNNILLTNYSILK